MRKTSKVKVGQVVSIFDVASGQFIEHGAIMAMTRRGAVFRTVEVRPAKVVPTGIGVSAKIINHHQA